LCAKLKENKDYYQLSTGDLLRQEVAAKSDIGIKCSEIMKAGGLVSDELVIDLVSKHLKTLKD
jgi:adenylate kinase